METSDSTLKTTTAKPKGAVAEGNGAAQTPASEPSRPRPCASQLLKQVSDPTRLQVIQTLAEGERHVAACENN